MRKIFIGLTLLVAFSVNLHAKTTDEKLQELFNTMNMDATINTMYQQMQSMMNSRVADRPMSSEQQEIYNKYQEELLSLMQKEMGWDDMQEDLMVIYKQNFTDQEISDMLAFYKSPTGQSVLQKMPVVMQEGMQVGQQMAMKAMPKIRAISDKMVKEMEAASQQ
jgi:hypothetical protein